ncbi:hypothetical protein FSARC_8392 [Fusarium sarcochroum]|uniref:Uncharacterized protein n=1 Tax=Fusarium sarcochroum TaxID=1208366 RepID=A0A8H4TT86_9HYPO|nr:hypothetical protein FSARC_8392 [Fusarium sarcochroum]
MDLEVIDDTACECRNLGVDGDVAGLGVRSATWAQVGTLMVISLIGTFHRQSTGAKEIGAGLALTHVSLVIALLVQLAHQKLTPINAVVGCMILDAQNSALSMQLASKETLAARWQVLIVIAIRALGLIVMGLIMRDPFNNLWDMSECCCLPETRLTWLSTGDLGPIRNHLSWALSAPRIIGFLQVSLHSLCNTFRFHEAEPKRGDEGTNEQKKGKRVKDITCLETDANGNPAHYVDYPATVSSMYFISTGQIMALVVAGATIVRAIWLFFVNLIKPNVSNFISPSTTSD